MEIIYSDQNFPDRVTSSIFLMGPTPRSSNVKSWRDDAIKYLQQINYDGTVFVPEASDGSRYPEYDAQVDWETVALNRADIIVCWLDRELETMPGFTTNTEFGEWYKSGKLIFGAPDTAQKVKYQIKKARAEFVPVVKTLQEALDTAVSIIDSGISRKGGECQVPLHIWRTPAFLDWYRTLKEAGNRLDGAEVVWTFRVGLGKQMVFLWALHVDVYVAAEKRHKTNEVVISRPDISAVVLYRKAKKLEDSEIVLVKEFRSPVNNKTGFVWEVPGGSSFKGATNLLQLAAEEVEEETGLQIHLDRIHKHGDRQLLATLSGHKAHLFSVELRAGEINWLKERAGVVNGVAEDSERTYVEVLTLKQIMQERLVDWSNLGMILSVLAR